MSTGQSLQVQPRFGQSGLRSRWCNLCTCNLHIVWSSSWRPRCGIATAIRRNDISNYVVMLSSCNLGDKVLYGMHHWKKLGSPRQVHYVIRHGVACLYYDIDALWFFPHFHWWHVPAAQDVLSCFPLLSKRFWNLRPNSTATVVSRGQKTGGKGDFCLSLWKPLSFWICWPGRRKTQLA